MMHMNVSKGSWHEPTKRIKREASGIPAFIIHFLLSQEGKLAFYPTTKSTTLEFFYFSTWQGTNIYIELAYTEGG